MTTACTDCSTATVECGYCRTHLCAEHAVAGQPLITVRQLLTTTFSTALHAPSLLGDILFKELDQVSYCAACREIVSERRQSEQLKLVGSMLLMLLCIVSLPLYMFLT